MKKKHINTLVYFLSLLTFSMTQTYHFLSSNKIVKEWTFVVYMASDNNLYYFARQNLEAMKNIGSNNRINIIVQIDHRGESLAPERLYIEKGKINKLEKDNESFTTKIDFGQVETLVDCMKWAATEYPAKHYALVLWNHGIGAVDSIVGKTVNSSELFVFNPGTGLLELNRGINFLEHFTEDNDHEKRGICFSDTYSTYITNHKLEIALQRISTEALNGNKIDILAFDACLMAMIEIASLAAPYASIMVGSQEVELGTGWPYEKILKLVAQEPLTPADFAQHIVLSYHDYYQSITKDFTQSALDLTYISELENNILQFAILTSPLLKNPTYQLLNKFIKTCKSKKLCTAFSEPSYIDLYHFYKNLLDGINVLKSPSALPAEFIREFEALLVDGLQLIKKIVIKNSVGKNLEKAHGVSIYFPSYKVHSSYTNTSFGARTGWLNFLQTFL